MTSAVAGLLLTLQACGAGEIDGQTADAGDFAASPEPIVRMETNHGSFFLQLDEEAAPVTTLNFLRYVTNDFYSGTIFHRIDRDKMIQGGIRKTNLEPKLEGLLPPIENEWRSGLKNARGTIGMVRPLNQPDAAQAEFYINLANNPGYDMPRDGAAYTAFGEVVSGMEIIEDISEVQLQPLPHVPNAPPSIPTVPVVIESTELISDFDIAELERQVEQVRQARSEEVAQAQAEEAAAVQQIIEETRQEYGAEFQTTPSGLRYAVLREGEGPKPEGPMDNVRVHYRGWLPGGEQFDSSYDRGAPSTFQLNQVIAGWTEGVGDMRVGEMRRLIVPGDLGYGAAGAPPDIPPNATLVFDVELIELP